MQIYLPIAEMSVNVFVILGLGGGVGFMFGARAGAKLKGEQLRSLLALMVLGVCVRLLFDMVSIPGELFATGAGGKH